MCSKLVLPTCKWCRLYISHTPHKLRKSEAVFYVDNLKAEAAIKYPSAANFVRIYAGCSGCHGKATPATESHSNFKGLLGAVRVFDEPVALADIPSERFGQETCVNSTFQSSLLFFRNAVRACVRAPEMTHMLRQPHAIAGRPYDVPYSCALCQSEYVSMPC